MKKKRLLASIVTATILFTMVPMNALASDNAIQNVDAEVLDTQESLKPVVDIEENVSSNVNTVEMSDNMAEEEDTQQLESFVDSETAKEYTDPETAEEYIQQLEEITDALPEDLDDITVENASDYRTLFERYKQLKGMIMDFFSGIFNDNNLKSRYNAATAVLDEFADKMALYADDVQEYLMLAAEMPNQEDLTGEITSEYAREIQQKIQRCEELYSDFDQAAKQLTEVRNARTIIQNIAKTLEELGFIFAHGDGWEIEQNVLTISKDFPVTDNYFNVSSLPWYSSSSPSRHKKITKVVVTDDVTILPYGILNYLFNLQEIDLGSGLEEIGINVFDQKRGLFESGYQPTGELTLTVRYENVSLEDILGHNEPVETLILDNPDLVVADEYQPGDDFYSVCSNNHLKTLVVKNAKRIGNGAFEGMEKLETVEFDQIETIAYRAFFAYYNNEFNLTRVQFAPDCKLKEIGQSAFEECQNLQGSIEIPESCEYIASYAFQNCNSITELTIPDKTKIGYSNIFSKFEDLKNRMVAILDGQFQLGEVSNDDILTVPDGWESSRLGKQNSASLNGTQITKAARWIDEDKTQAQVQLQFSYTKVPGKDFIFIVDYSGSMAEIGNLNENNDSRFSDMQSKLLDVSDKLLNTAGYDNRVAVLSFDTKTAANSESFTKNLSDVENFLLSDAPYGSTNYAVALQEAKNLIDSRADKSRDAVVIFISDGKPNRNLDNTTSNSDIILSELEQIADTIKDEGISIYGVMQSVPESEEEQSRRAMQLVCTDGLFFHAKDTAEFSEAVNKTIGAAFGRYILKDVVHENFTLDTDSLPDDVSYDADTATITWDLTGALPYTDYVLTLKITLNSEDTENTTYPEGDFDTNLGDAVLYDRVMQTSVNTVSTPVLSRGNSEGGGGAHHPDPDPDPDPDDNDDDEEEIIDEEVPLAETPWLNTVDHYAYIVGYPEDYVTGQPTEDESRWPVKPQANISRAEVATIFFRLLTDEARDQFWMTTNNFPDVAPDAWYNNAISTMVNAGIIQGYEDGAFRPNNNITRAEFAAIASRFMSSGYDVEEDLFTDIANHWARENINDAAMTQWIHGYPDGTFLPDQAITRAEAVTLVNNVLQRKPDADHMLDNMIKWPDNPESAWYYEAIQEATNSHDYDLFEDAEYETWTALQENRDWAALEKDWVNTHRTGGEVA